MLDDAPTLDAAIREAIEREPETFGDAEFNALARRVFAHQFANNRVYRRFCEARGASPDAVVDFCAIPAVPSTAFKSTRLASFPEEATHRVLTTSGTSSQVPGKIHLDLGGLELAKASYRRTGELFLFGERAVSRALLLIPPADEVPHMGLALGVDEMASARGVIEKVHFLRNGALDVGSLLAALADAQKSGVPVAILGASFAHVHLMEALAKEGIRFQLPSGSLVFDGGGYKGRSRELSPEEFDAAIGEAFGVPSSHRVNVLGLTEMQVCFADGAVRDRVRGASTTTRRKLNPHWTRTIAVDPNTLERLPRGEIGLLRHVCLANRATVIAVQTDDLGKEVDDGFVILGRASGAEARGCSIAMDELLAASGAQGIS